MSMEQNKDNRNFRMQHILDNGGIVKISAELGVNGVLATEEEITSVFDYAKDAALNVLKNGVIRMPKPENAEEFTI